MSGGGAAPRVTGTKVVVVTRGKGLVGFTVGGNGGKVRGNRDKIGRGGWGGGK